MEEKKYSVIGTVEIGTDEYRDLIEDALNQKSCADNYMSKYWSEQSKVRELEGQLSDLKDRIALYEGFLNDADDRTAFEIYVVRQQRGE